MKKLFFLFLIIPSLLNAQSISGVTGTVTHNGSVTIAGSSFGTKATAAPLKVDNFNSVTIGSNISTSTADGPSWINEVASQCHNPIASTTKPRPNSVWTKNWQSHWDTACGSSKSVSTLSIQGQTLTKLLLDAWMYQDTSGATGFVAGQNNFKFIRAHQTGAQAPNVGLTNTGPLNGGTGPYAIAGDSRNDTTIQSFADCGGSLTNSQFYNQWVHVTWAIDVGSGGTATDGKVRVYINSVLQCTSDAVNFLNTGFSSYQELYIGNYIRNDSEWTGDIYAYWEHVYLDTTWARVEISNNVTYASSTHREMCVPTAWSDTSITCQVNRGSFQSGDTVYFHVCSATNVCSAGFSKQLDASVSTNPAKLPSGKRMKSL